jgi:DNA repair protein RecO (recombination protein O)
LRLARELLPERAPEPDVYDCLVEALELLDQGAAPRSLQLCCEARMLSLTGFAPMLTSCVSCGREPKPNQAALLSVARGGIVCRACGGAPERIAGSLRHALQDALEGAPLDGLASMSDADVREGERLLSLFVAQLLQHEHKLDKRL